MFDLLPDPQVPVVPAWPMEASAPTRASSPRPAPTSCTSPPRASSSSPSCQRGRTTGCGIPAWSRWGRQPGGGRAVERCGHDGNPPPALAASRGSCSCVDAARCCSCSTRSSRFPSAASRCRFTACAATMDGKWSASPSAPRCEYGGSSVPSVRARAVACECSARIISIRSRSRSARARLVTAAGTPPRSHRGLTVRVPDPPARPRAPFVRSPRGLEVPHSDDGEPRCA